jgi:hypothetical protein
MLPRGLLDRLGLSVAQDPFCKRAALTWLLEKAAWRETSITIAGRPVMLRRGQVSHSVRHLAAQWGWDEKKVRRFLKKLIAVQAITVSDVAGQHVISIVDYNENSSHGPDADASLAPLERRPSAAPGSEKYADQDYGTSDRADDSAAPSPHQRRSNAAIEEKEKTKKKPAPPSGEARQLPLLRVVATDAPPAAPPAHNPNPRGTRLPTDWCASPADRDYATEQGVDIARTEESFRDYWTAKAGKDGRKVSWSATWRTWCRREAEWQQASAVPRKLPAKETPLDAGERYLREKYGLAEPGAGAGDTASGGPIIDGKLYG